MRERRHGIPPDCFTLSWRTFRSPWETVVVAFFPCGVIRLAHRVRDRNAAEHVCRQAGAQVAAAGGADHPIVGGRAPEHEWRTDCLDADRAPDIGRTLGVIAAGDDGHTSSPGL